MTVKKLKQLLRQLKAAGIGDDFEVYLSRDAEGNQFHPIAEPPYAFAMDSENQRLILFPNQ